LGGSTRFDGSCGTPGVYETPEAFNLAFRSAVGLLRQKPAYSRSHPRLLGTSFRPTFSSLTPVSSAAWETIDRLIAPKSLLAFRAATSLAARLCFATNCASPVKSRNFKVSPSLRVISSAFADANRACRRRHYQGTLRATPCGGATNQMSPSGYIFIEF
jgi:hypothetical protein